MSNRIALVSVVIPCYNQAHFLGEAIESVVSQTHSPIETIVVDDGSTDGTADVAAAYRVRCVRQENRGLPEARNTGIRVSNGEAVLFLDSDDLLAHDAVAAAVACISSHAAAAFAFGRPKIVGLRGEEVVPEPVESNFYEELLRRNYIMMPGLVLYRRWVFDRIGLFDPRLDAAEDYDLYLRITRSFPIVFCAEMHGM